MRVKLQTPAMESGDGKFCGCADGRGVGENNRRTGEEEKRGGEVKLDISKN